MPEIRITPGGFVTSKPRHMIGEHGASPFLTSPFTIEGFQNLINLYGDIAWPMLNSTGDPLAGDGTNFLGNIAQGAQNNIDMVQQAVMSTIVVAQQTDAVSLAVLNNNGEFVLGVGSAASKPNVGAELFTTAGTITVAAGSSTVTGAGSTWTADVLTGPYGITPNLNKIYRGDILRVRVNAGEFISFRITAVTNNTHLEIWPTPTAGNPAIGAGLQYTIWRTGYNSYSRVINFTPSGSTSTYFYYAGNLNNNSSGYPHGTIECAAQIFPVTDIVHFMAPQLTDAAGSPVGELLADDIAYYKGFILYGAGPLVSWSAPGAPTTLPFGTADFPAKNFSIVDASSSFVSFEYLGDQVVALFEDSMWLVTATGSVPEFAFYKLPELESIINPSRVDPSNPPFVTVMNNYGRPSTSGRGAIYYTSNRGIEQMGGSLATEISAPVSTSLRALFGASPLYVGWDNAADTVLVRNALGVTSPTALVYNVGRSEWSTLQYAPPVGAQLAALTPSIQTKTRNTDHTRLYHYGYYETVTNGGVPITNGGNIRYVAALLDENTPTAGLVAWEWLTPMIPVGLNYPDFSLGGFVFDAYSLNSLPVTVTWTLYGGSSPYNIFQRDTNTLSFAGTLPSSWISSRQRLAKKVDDPYLLLKFTSTAWVAPVAVTLFPSETQVVR